MPNLTFKEALRRLDLTQGEAAEALGVSARTVSSWANNDDIPRYIELALRHLLAEDDRRKARRAMELPRGNMTMDEKLAVARERIKAEAEADAAKDKAAGLESGQEWALNSSHRALRIFRKAFKDEDI